MGDIFKEQLVKKAAGGADTAKKAGLILLPFAVGAAAALTPAGAFAVFFAAAAVFVSVFLWRYTSVEYEYIFTNGALDIDIIYGKQRRKRAVSVDLKEIDALERIDYPDPRVYPGCAIRDFSGGVKGPGKYALQLVQKGVKMRLIIEPNEELLASITQAVPRRKIITH